MLFGAGRCYARPDKATFTSAIIYRGDGTGTFPFRGSGLFYGTTADPDGLVRFVKSPGRYELKDPISAKGTITGLTLSWAFEGEVTMEVSATGSSEGYVEAINGVPLEKGSFSPGSQIKWRATLSPGSKLEEVRITYTDSSGVVGDWGTPELSGFQYRKPIFIKGSEQGMLFNYQMQIKVAEASSPHPGPLPRGERVVTLSKPLQSDFSDLRFTLSDGRTLVPYYLEEVIASPKGAKQSRIAAFWLKIPQIPRQGLLLYLYYSNPRAESLSDGDKVFSFFDDFNTGSLDTEKWVFAPDNELGRAEVADNRLTLSAARVLSKTYRFVSGLIEYKAKVSSSDGAVAAVIRGNSDLEKEGKNRLAFSSNAEGAQHCIAVGNSIVANAKEGISANTVYGYRIAASGSQISFSRYNADWSKEEASIDYNDKEGPLVGYLGLAAGSRSSGVSFDWVRVRKPAAYPPQVDSAAVKKAPEEAVNLAEFQGVTVAKNGDLVLAAQKEEGYYISPLISSSFKARVIVPQWKAAVPEDASLKADVSAAENRPYKEDCASGSYYYASKKDFSEGDKLRWRVRMSATNPLPKGERVGVRGSSSEAPALKEFTLDYRPGKIELVWPNDGEALRAGSRINIVWDAEDYGPLYPMDLFYSTDAGRKFKPIAEKTENSGKYLWLVPDELTNRGVLKVADGFDKSIYDLSDSRLSIVESGGVTGAESEAALKEPVAAGEEEVAIDELVEKGRRPGTKLYDVVIKLSDRYASDPDRETKLQRGDILLVKPSGHNWSETERASLLILEVYLTEKEAEELTKPVEVSTGKSDAEGRPITKMLKRRAKRINLEKLGLSGKERSQNKLRQIEETLKGKELKVDEVVEER